MKYNPDQVVTVAILEEILDRKLEEKLEQKLEQKFNEKFSEFALKLIEFFEPRFRAIEERLDRLEAIVTEHTRMFEELFAKYETLRQEYIITNHQFKRVETYILQSEARTQECQKDICELKSKVDRLQTQVDYLEKQITSQS